MIVKIDDNALMIDVPVSDHVWDLDKAVNKVMRNMVEPGYTCVVNMENVINVYNATIQFLLRISDRAKRLENPVYIINASEPVCNALNRAGVNEKIFICENYLMEELAEA